jgi:hypothetical protein
LILISAALAAWICRVSSIRLRSTCWRTRSTSSSGRRPPLANVSKATRWSTSVPVMTSPLTIAVALMIEGIAVPNTCGASGRRSEAALLGSEAGRLASCAAAAPATARATAAAARRVLAGKSS